MREAIQRLLRVLGIVIVTALLVISYVVWRRQTNPDPTAVYWQALQRTMSTPGITCTSDETNNSITTKQVIELDLSSRATAHAWASVTQVGTSVMTEEITTHAADYMRYTAIKSPTKLDLTQVLNVWSTVTGPTSSKPLYGRTALGGCVFPLADLSNSEVKPLLATLKTGTVFKTTPATALRSTLAAHPTYIYDVSVQPSSYIAFMQQVAKAIGLTDLDNLDVSSYSQAPAVALKVYINPRSSEVQQIVFSSGAHTVRLSNYGRRPQLVVPQSTISSQQLSQRLQSQ